MRKNSLFRPLGVYVPELWAFRQKDSPTCRELLEDVAVLDRERLRILTSRGKRFTSPLPQELWEKTTSPRLVPENRGSFLLFPIAVEDATLTLVLYLPRPAKLVSATLCQLDRREFSGLTKPAGEDPQLFSLLGELLFYLDRLLAPQKSLPFWTVVLRSANFAGCKLKRDRLSAANLQLSKEEIPLFFVFLVCFFLSVRASGLSAEVDFEHASPCCNIRFGALSADEQTIDLPKTPFLDCPAFRRFSPLPVEDGQRLLLSMRLPGAEVSSGGLARYTTVFLDCFRQKAKKTGA